MRFVVKTNLTMFVVVNLKQREMCNERGCLTLKLPLLSKGTHCTIKFTFIFSIIQMDFYFTREVETSQRPV